MKAALVVALACAACGTAPAAVSPSAGAERTASSALPAPQVQPARYLRSLEFEPNAYGVQRDVVATDLLLGDLLFHSPYTLGQRAQSLGMSCNTCHPNGATHNELFIEGVSNRPGNVDLSSRFFRPAADDGVANALNIPSLRGCRYTGPYGRDGRTASLAEFVQGVAHAEFDGSLLSEDELGALLRYVQDLDFLPNSLLDARNGLTPRASDAARRGAIAFAADRPGFGGMSCATCHPASTFFRDGRVHRLGSGRSPSPHAVDGAYETPSLLGLAETAPYFHDGRFANLRDVVRWFDESFDLKLEPQEFDDLVAYVEAVGAVDRPRDTRPLAMRLDQVFAYVTLLPSASARVRTMVVEAIEKELAAAPSPLRERVKSLAESLRQLAEQAPSNQSRKASETLRHELSRLAADWAGSLAPEIVQSKTTVLLP
ncbi:MAG: cytochrome c peroxidase [Myxococcota bacterium]